MVVATSNVAPDDLYKGGLNRALFLPFIKQITDHMDVRGSMPAPTSGWKSFRAYRCG